MAGWLGLLSTPAEGTPRCVKGRAGGGAMKVNEGKQACHLGKRYWLYAVFDCAAPASQLLRVQDPFAKLLASRRAAAGSGAGAVRIVEDRIVLAAVD